jgi:diguanylate cyclase (GGDEF)-like protein
MVPAFGPIGSAPPADPQTGLDVSSTWGRWLREEETRVRRYRHPATLVLVEVEGLDRLIERLGTEAAERLIPPIAATMRRHARESDRIARLGPARFGALLPETDEVAAINYVERVRTTCDLWLAAGAVSLRLSMGWAEANASRSMDVALEAAEGRLHVERHRETLATDPEPTTGFEGSPRTSPAT